MSLDRSSTRALAQLLADAPPDPATPDGLRALVTRIAEINGPGPRPARESGQTVPGTDVHVRLVGVAEPPSGLIVMLGLGGWVAGAPGPHETVARKLAERTSCDVALIDFRRAPVHPYPAPIDDVYAATRWLWHERPALGLGDTPMMVLGEGMGAALAAATVHRALRDPGGPRFALQLLICPVLDASADLGTGGRDHVTEAPVTRAMFDRMWDCYLPGPGLRSDPDASPAGAADWRGAPPTLVITAGHDDAEAEGAAFAARLRAADVPVTQRHFEDQMHGFFSTRSSRCRSAPRGSGSAPRCHPRRRPCRTPVPWSTGANIPCKPRTVLFYLGSYGANRKELDKVTEADYVGLEFVPAELAGPR